MSAPPRIVAVVQARLSSQRLPGKVLRPLEGRPLLDHLLERLRACRGLDGIVVATSADPSDDAVAAYARERALGCHRGPLDDVARRLLDAATAAGADALVRVNGDSPLLDPALVDRGVAMFRAGGADVVTNVQTRSFPKGQSVEVLACAALARAIASMTDAAQREHVTPYVYAHPERFTIRAFEADAPRPALQLSVDDGDDFERCAAILRHLAAHGGGYGWQACVRAYDALAAAR